MAELSISLIDTLPPTETSELTPSSIATPQRLDLFSDSTEKSPFSSPFTLILLSANFVFAVLSIEL